MPTGNSCESQGGFTYLTVLAAIAVAGVVLAKAGIDWGHAGQREKERELLYVGNQYRRAIALYYERTPGATKRYPARLEDMLTDTRYSSPQHYLRKLYRNPFTNQQQWGTIKAPDGGIMGVYSLSDTAPLKRTNFNFENRAFEGATKYSDWKFFYAPRVLVSM